MLSVGEGGLLCTDDDDVAAFVRSRRSHAMTSGTWDRHSGRTDTYDVIALGFNYRLDEPRSALLLSRLQRLESEIDRRRELTVRYRSLLKQVDGIIVPFEDDDVPGSSCYVIPIMLDEDGRQADVSSATARSAASRRASSTRRSTASRPTASASPTSRCRSPSSRRGPS